MGKLSEKRKLLSAISEAIIPETDTPGASRANVADFIIHMITFCTEKKLQISFMVGLDQLEHNSLSKFNKSFCACNLDQQVEMLTAMERKAFYSSELINKVYRKLFGEMFIIHVKKLTIEGYCTSRLGATQGLVYDYIPVNYNACIPLKANQRSWATK
ncbi:Gluconate 2-dehydrogenase subunit 3 [bacterium A37T11]|nr:Gluconate 2-dehydrogenase subunit 3 [bacterium A37T11]